MGLIPENTTKTVAWANRNGGRPTPYTNFTCRAAVSLTLRSGKRQRLAYA